MHSINPIGIIHSELKRLEDCPKQENEGAPAATVEIYPAFAEAAKDIKPGDRIILLTWLHQSKRDTMVTRPRDNKNAKLTGVFSTRSPDRPNPIGLHISVVHSVKDNILKVAEIEVLDGTPVIDIKPYLER